jgi:NitT/TauT family transport system substrate-binding protein
MGVIGHARIVRFACLTAAALALAPDPVAAQSTIRFSLDLRPEGPNALFLLPLDRGYFKSEGLDVTMEEGSTASDPITRVASGGSDMGFTDINALVKYRDQNPAAPIKAVFMVFNKPPYAVVGRRSRGISDAKSLENKKLGASPAGTTFGQWPLFAKINDIDPSKVTIETIGVPVRAPMLAAGQLDAVLGYSFRVYVDLIDRGVPVEDVATLRMADHGLRLYGSAIVVNSKFAADKPEAVRAFLRAFLHGLRDTVGNPAAAVDYVLKRDNTAKKEVELERLRMAIRDNIVTPEVRANGFGRIDYGRLKESIDQIGLAFPFKSKPKAEDIFDSSMLPPVGDRSVN